MERNRKLGGHSVSSTSAEEKVSQEPKDSKKKISPVEEFSPPPLNNPMNRKIVGGAPPPPTLDDDEDDEESGSLLRNPKVIIGIAAAVLVVILVIVIMVVNSKPMEPEIIAPPVEEVVVEAPISESERIKMELESVGIGQDFYASRENQTLVKADTVFSLEGKDVPELWTMKNNKSYAFITTMVPYTKHRAVTGVGVEIYWLEGEYNGQPCKFTIPYVYYKSLADSGSCAVQVEVIETSSGEKIATSFQFDYNAQANLGNNKR